MQTLQSLIKLYGEPDALIDHWDISSERFAIWGYDEIYSKTLDEIDTCNPLSEWQNTIDKWKLNTKNKTICAIGGFSYTMKSLLFPHLNFKSYKSNLPVIWFAKPKIIHKYQLDRTDFTHNNISIKLLKDIPTMEKYKEDVSLIKKYHEKGDIYQINYTNPKLYNIEVSPFNLYLSLRKIAKPSYGIYINAKNFQLLSASPERFFNTKNDTIKTYPIKGSRKRNKNSIVDQKIKTELYNSVKDRSEHLMIVDLLRNDLGKICKYGTIQTKNLYKVQSYETIHHMVTEISGKLLNELKESSIINALFPGGSITGAPKERAMEIIDLIENYDRKFYTGSLGYIKSNGEIDMNIAIRTMTISNKKGEYPVGGGIVWDSDPKLEWYEAHDKSAILKNINITQHV